jgi:hypothetical protein
MRLTVGPLPPAVYWRRRAAVATALALVIAPLVVMCRGRDASAPTARPSVTASPRVPDLSTSAPGSSTTAADGNTPSGPGSASAGIGEGGGDDGADSGSGNGGGTGGGNAAPPVVATVVCTDEEISLTVAVSPSPGSYGGVVTLTLIVRNTADHACLRDVGSAPQELQVSQGATLVWSSDSCGTQQTSDVRAFGPNIESRFWRSWNTYRVAPYECDPPAGVQPAEPGTYQVVARLGTKLSEPLSFEIRK